MQALKSKIQSKETTRLQLAAGDGNRTRESGAVDVAVTSGALLGES